LLVNRELTSPRLLVIRDNPVIRAADAKEVGVEDPAEETFCHPNHRNLKKRFAVVNTADSISCCTTQLGRQRC
jgi:hypothetical protein